MTTTSTSSKTSASNHALEDLCDDLQRGFYSLDDLDPDFAYAGIGSRNTPPQILEAMKDIAARLGDAGVALSSGGADGADRAFEEGALRTDGPVTVHVPWPGYNGYRRGRDDERQIDVVVPAHRTLHRGESYVDRARRHRLAWERCGRGARGLFVRNVSILAGAYDSEINATRRVRAVIAYNPNGRSIGQAAGGTGHSLRVAAELGIPALNLCRLTPREHNAAALDLVPPIIRSAVLERCPDLPR